MCRKQSNEKPVEKTIQYYNEHAQDFAANTLYIDFQGIQEKFAGRLPQGAYVLDFGCGAGRDTKFFLEQGFRVDAADGSKELCRIASAYTGCQVRNQLFGELNETEKYDGIWACSSILHLPVQELKTVFGKMAAAAKHGGIIYTSFKHGTFEGERNGRYFTDMTEASFADFIRGMAGLQIEEQWVTADVRPGRGEEKWLNLIVRKK